jgi:hypothetical protein
MSVRLAILASALGSAAALLSEAVLADDTIDQSRVDQGFASSPIPRSQLSLYGKDIRLVGLGSYLVNAAVGCGGCHSFPQFLPQGDTAGSNPAAGDPFQGTPSTQRVSGQLVANFSTSNYLAGGLCFGPFMTRNLTPDAHSLPEGLTEEEFVKVMRTGEDIHCEKSPHDPICSLGPPTPVLQVMPWPNFHSMTDLDLRAVYTYLTALPAANACNTVADGCPGFSGAAAKSATYVYKNTPACPNPAPP